MVKRASEKREATSVESKPRNGPVVPTKAVPSTRSPRRRGPAPVPEVIVARIDGGGPIRRELVDAMEKMMDQGRQPKAGGAQATTERNVLRGGGNASARGATVPDKSRSRIATAPPYTPPPRGPELVLAMPVEDLQAIVEAARNDRTAVAAWSYQVLMNAARRRTRHIPMLDDEEQVLVTAAMRSGTMSVSVWARRVLLAAARAVIAGG